MNTANKTLSFEFFPTRTPEDRDKQTAVREKLRRFNPAFFSCTSGAGGSTREGTLQTIADILAENTPAAPHLPCIGMNEAEIHTLLDTYRDMGVRRIVALRGDMPSGMGASGSGLRYAAELVELIRRRYGDLFRIEIAAYPEYHPQACSAAEDTAHFAAKARAGADSAITQYFYNADAYFRFVDDVRALGCTIPVVPGIMPVTGFAKLVRFSDTCGAEIPRWLRLKLQSYADDTESVQAFALDVVTDMCARLLEQGAPGLHFYTMNQSALPEEICRRLGFGA